MATSTPSPEAEFHEDLSRDEFDYDAVGPSLATRALAEAAGTFALVLIGVGAAAFLEVGGNGILAVGLSFGLTATAVIIAIGHISGAHINPAITVGAWLAGRFPGKDVGPYILAQVVGGAAGAGVVWLLAASTPRVADAQAALDSTAIGYGEHSPFEFSLTGGLIAEAVATGLFVAAVLAATSARAIKSLAPFVIGLSLAILINWTIPVTNASLNPARATASAVFSEPWALGQLWAWWVAGIAAAAIVGLLFRAFGADEDVDPRSAPTPVTNP